ALTAGVFGSGGIFSKIFSGQSIVETKSNRVAEFDWSNFMFKVLPRKVRNVGGGPIISGGSESCPTMRPQATGVKKSGNYAFPLAYRSDQTIPPGTFLYYTCKHWELATKNATDMFSNVSANLSHLPTIAYTNGTVRAIWEDWLKLQGDDGRWYFYAHQCNIFVQVGQHVNAGDVLGVTGKVGVNVTSATPEHLHFAINSSSKADDFPGGGGDICASQDFEAKFNLHQCFPPFCS
ncbi:MAG: hypothetical protein UX14_C0011G0001, partial [Parcubacteria group bacterium GW2011_GWF1_45_5]